MGSNPTLTVRPHDSSQTRHHLTLAVEQVVASDHLTAVTLALEDAPAGATLERILLRNKQQLELKLEDDRSRTYRLTYDVVWLPATALDVSARKLVFQPLQPLARRLMLLVPAVEVGYPGSAAFEVDVPAGLMTAAGDPDRAWPVSAPWEVDIPVEIAGYSVPFTKARLEELNGTTLLTLLSAPYRPAQSAKSLSGLRLAKVTAPGGRDVNLGSAFSSAGAERDGSLHRAMIGFDVVNAETGAVEPGCYRVELAGATVTVAGPWKLSWEVGAP